MSRSRSSRIWRVIPSGSCSIRKARTTPRPTGKAFRGPKARQHEPVVVEEQIDRLTAASTQTKELTDQAHSDLGSAWVAGRVSLLDEKTKSPGSPGPPCLPPAG